MIKDLAENLYLPSEMNDKVKYPTLVVLHPTGAVKDQTAGLYA